MVERATVYQNSVTGRACSLQQTALQRTVLTLRPYPQTHTDGRRGIRVARQLGQDWKPEPSTEPGTEKVLTMHLPTGRLPARTGLDLQSPLWSSLKLAHAQVPVRLRRPQGTRGGVCSASCDRVTLPLTCVSS